MARGDYYFPFLYQRFYDSTTGWTEEQEGCYMRLLTHQFKHGFIPNDMKLIKRISPKSVKNWSLFRQKFEQNSEGNLINLSMENIRQEFIRKREINYLNGKKGGRPITERLTQTITETVTENITIPVTNNQKSIKEEGVLQSGPALDLSNSNLFRQPIKPTKQQVLEAIVNAGGTKEMAKSFWLKHEAAGWFINGSPVVSYSALAQRFVANWKSKDESDNQSSAPPLEKYKNGF